MSSAKNSAEARGKGSKSIGMSSNPSKAAAKRETSTELVLRTRDMEILSAVHQHRFLTTDLIWRLVRDGGPGSLDYIIGKDGRKRPKLYGFGLKALYKRLALLHKAGFLARHYVTDQPYGASHGSPRAVYGIGSEAAPPLADHLGMPVHEIRDIVEANRVKSPYLRHALEVAKFRITLALACTLSEGRIQLIFWEQGVKLRDSVLGTNEQGRSERYSVYPDAFFAISIGQGRRAHYALELDRGTMPIVASSNRPDLRKKIIGYWWYRQSRAFASRYRYAASPYRELTSMGFGQTQAETDRVGSRPLPINGFRVLFLFPESLESSGKTSGRLDHVLSLIRYLGREYASSAFYWLATADTVDPTDPISIFAPFWLTANPTKGRQSLITRT